MRAERATSPTAGDYFSIAYSRFTNGYPVPSQYAMEQREVVHPYVMRNPKSSASLAMLAFAKALGTSPKKTIPNCLREIFSLN